MTSTTVHRDLEGVGEQLLPGRPRLRANRSRSRCAVIALRQVGQLTKSGHGRGSRPSTVPRAHLPAVRRHQPHRLADIQPSSPHGGHCRTRCPASVSHGHFHSAGPVPAGSSTLRPDWAGPAAEDRGAGPPGQPDSAGPPRSHTSRWTAGTSPPSPGPRTPRPARPGRGNQPGSDSWRARAGSRTTPSTHPPPAGRAAAAAGAARTDRDRPAPLSFHRSRPAPSPVRQRAVKSPGTPSGEPARTSGHSAGEPFHPGTRARARHQGEDHGHDDASYGPTADAARLRTPLRGGQQIAVDTCASSFAEGSAASPSHGHRNRKDPRRPAHRPGNRPRGRLPGGSPLPATAGADRREMAQRRTPRPLPRRLLLRPPRRPVPGRRPHHGGHRRRLAEAADDRRPAQRVLHLPVAARSSRPTATSICRAGTCSSPTRPTAPRATSAKPGPSSTTTMPSPPATAST